MSACPGNPSLITGEEESDYYPFGGERVLCDRGIGNNYKFTGKERDSETGLDEFGARYYSSFYGRFTIPDWAAAPTAVPYAKFGDPQSLNLYSYVENAPVNRADADGHDFDFLEAAKYVVQGISDGAAIGAAAGAAIGGTGGTLVAPGVGTVGGVVAGSVAGSIDGAITGGLVGAALYFSKSTSESKSNPQENRERGLEKERETLQKEGLEKNTKTFKATDPKTGKAGGTVPDAVRENGQTVERKSVQKLSFTKQLRLQTEVSKQSGQKPEVIVDKNTKVYKPVKDNMNVKVE
jgi:RHS repeat-associated protein